MNNFLNRLLVMCESANLKEKERKGRGRVKHGERQKKLLDNKYKPHLSKLKITNDSI